MPSACAPPAARGKARLASPHPPSPHPPSPRPPSPRPRTGYCRAQAAPRASRQAAARTPPGACASRPPPSPPPPRRRRRPRPRRRACAPRRTDRAPCSCGAASGLRAAPPRDRAARAPAPPQRASRSPGGVRPVGRRALRAARRSAPVAAARDSPRPSASAGLPPLVPGKASLGRERCGRRPARQRRHGGGASGPRGGSSRRPTSAGAFRAARRRRRGRPWPRRVWRRGDGSLRGRAKCPASRFTKDETIFQPASARYFAKYHPSIEIVLQQALRSKLKRNRATAKTSLNVEEPGHLGVAVRWRLLSLVVRRTTGRERRHRQAPEGREGCAEV
eukprot:scaffold21900_cov67-Phaeocystis_antarctica.AAC.5